MAFDLTLEPPIPLSQVVKLPWIPRRRRGRKLHISTVFRWVRPGVRGVRLECIRFAGTLVTSEAALKRFFAALTVADPRCVQAPTTPPSSPAARSRAKRRADKELARAGI